MGVRLRRCVAVMVAVCCVALPSAARAESIQSISNNIVITTDGVAQFREEISYAFSGQKHGIFRDVPYVGQIAQDKYLYYDFQLESVTRDGASEPASQSQSGVYERLKIGDANKTVSGTQNYVIEYSLSPVVRKDPAGDYITLNIHGTGWEVGATSVKGDVVLPIGAKLLDRQCFTGKQGSKKTNCTVQASSDGQSVQVNSTQPLDAGEGLSLDLVLEPGVFSESAYAVVSSTKPASGDGGAVSGIFGLFQFLTFIPFLIAGGVAIVFVRRAMARSARRKQETIVVQYEAPAKLTPGQVGLMSDEVADSREITAMLIDLARRGHITISYEQQKQLIGTKERFLLTRTNSQDQLSAAEQILVLGVFAATEAVYVDDLQPTSMYKVVQNVRSQLLIDLQAAGLFAAKQKAFSPDNLTEKGYDVWAQVEGLKLYLDVAEKDRMKFAEAPDKTPERFTKLLPYAIALGVERQWAKQFEGIDIEPATRGWYHGVNGSNPALFVGLMSNSFATSVASHSTPPSSSGGAGGGFSGGGAGGGGGGSW